MKGPPPPGKAVFVSRKKGTSVTEKSRDILFALREKPRILVPVVVWIVLSVLVALASPFETSLFLTPAGRLAYWALIVGLSVLLDLGFRGLLAGRGLLLRLVARGGFAVVLGGLVYGVNGLVFGPGSGRNGWLFLVGVVWAVAVGVELLVALSRWVHLHNHPVPQAASQADTDPDPADAMFQRRLPLDRRGALLRLEAQDHYLKVVTQAGEALILMRLSDAEAELAGFPGLRVHRSHWVAQDAVQSVRRREGRLFLILPDGAEVPVSRSYRPAVEAAGLTA